DLRNPRNHARSPSTEWAVDSTAEKLTPVNKSESDSPLQFVNEPAWRGFAAFSPPEDSFFGHGDMHFGVSRALAGRKARLIVPDKAVPFRTGRCSQGGVKVPTGGKGESPSPRAPCSRKRERVSRFGATPKPTVTVRMKENGLRRFARIHFAWAPAFRVPWFWS